MGEYPRLRHGRQSLEPKIVFAGRGVVGVENTVLVSTGPPERLTITPRELVVL